MEPIAVTLDAVCLASRIILESGGETYRAEETVERMCQGLGVPQVDVLALPTGLMLTLTLEDDTTLTRIVRVHSRSINLTRVDECNSISRKVAKGDLSAQEALQALRRLSRLKPLPPALLTLASALSAAGFAVMLGGMWVDFVVALFCGAAMQLVQLPLGRYRVPGMISGLICGALVTLMALCSTRLLPQVAIEPIISGTIMPLLPGLATTNGIRDTIRGDLVSGGARLVEAMLSAMMLAAGVGVMLSIWKGAGV